jgi:hypothetical protein
MRGGHRRDASAAAAQRVFDPLVCQMDSPLIDVVGCSRSSFGRAAGTNSKPKRAIARQLSGSRRDWDGRNGWRHLLVSNFKVVNLRDRGRKPSSPAPAATTLPNE